MDSTENKTNQQASPQQAVEMSPLELNDIRLDPNHTILTPDYLENITSKATDNQEI